MSKSWDEVKTLLDNPSVPPEQKQELLEAWIEDQPEGRIEDEQKRYIKNYAPSSEYDDQDENTYEGDNDEDTSADVDEAYGNANQSAKDAAGKDGSAAEDAGVVREDEGKLDGKTEPGPDAGTKNSDELLDLGNSALRMYRDFCPILRERPGDLQGEVKDIDFDTEVMDRFHENRGIAFDKMLAESGRFRTAKTTVDEMVHDIDGKLISLYGSWHGEAAQASSQWYSSTITPSAKDLMTYLGGAADHIDGAVKSIFGAVKSKVDQVQRQYSPEIAQATPDIARKVFALARGEGKDNADRVGEVAGWVDSKVGSDMNRRLDDENCELEPELQEYVVQQCRKWVSECFNKDLKTRYVDGFLKTCKETNRQINEHYDTLNQYLAKYESKFKNYEGPGAEESGTGDSNGSTDSGDSSQTGPSQSSGPGASQPGATAQVPAETAMPGENGQGPDGQVPGSATSPSAVTPGANGQPGEDGPGERPQQVTVTEGDKKLEMTGPGADGKMALSVDDGKGPTNNYEIDFGDGEGPDAVGAEDGKGQDGSNDPEGGAPEGSGPEAKGADDTKEIKADENGKAVIHDGDTTITVQRHENGEVTVTTDDGKGEPTTYTLEGGEDGAGSISGDGSKDGSGDGADDGADTGPSAGDRGLSNGSFSGDLFDGAGGGSGGSGDIGGGSGGGGAAGGGGAGGGARVGAGSQPSPGAQFGAMNAQEMGGGGAAAAGAVPAAASAGGGPGGGAGGQGGLVGGAPLAGGMGAGAGQGGDSERGASQWRTVGELFDDDPAAGALRNVRGVLGED